MRYVGLDVGKKDIGIAVGEVIAQELLTVSAKKDQSNYEGAGLERACEEIKKIKQTEQADAIVVGLPVNEDGQETEESKHIKEFGNHLGQYLNCQVHYVDETLTSFMAQDMLEEQGVSGRELEERIHQLAAQLILQQYFEENAIA